MEYKRYNLMIVAEESEPLKELNAALVREGFECRISPFDEDVLDRASRHIPDAIVVEINGYSIGSEIWNIVHRIKGKNASPLVALVNRKALGDIEGNPDVDDFLAAPYDATELILRIRRLMDRAEKARRTETIECDDLVIDFARCEVTIGGVKADLTYKEYELLKFLASNRGRVFTREALLDKVWGMDYYGGDRTVDVHIRRLRSKIESPRNDFIETVRNIGYRFKKDI